MTRLSSPSRQMLLAGTLYLCWTMVLVTPLLPTIGSALPGDAGDPLLNAAILGWNARHVPLTTDWWNFPAFAPVTEVTAFTEHLLGLSLFATPIVVLSGNPILAYNLTFIGLFVAAGLSMFALARFLTGDPVASFIAGLVFAFPLYAASHVAHIQVLATCWMPLCLLGLHAYKDSKRKRWLWLVGAGWLLSGLSNSYLLVFFSVLVLGWIAWHLFQRAERRALINVLLTIGGSTLILAPILIKYRTVHQRYDLSRPMNEILFYSGDVLSILIAPANLAFWSWLQPMHLLEAQFFPGITVLLVVFVGLRPWLTASKNHPSHSMWRTILFAVSTAAALVALFSTVIGPLRTEIAGIAISLTQPYKSLSVALLGFFLFGVSSPTVRSAWKRTDSSAFYALAAFLTWLLALGPRPTILGEPFLYRGPYALLLMVPGVDGLRVPARFWAVTILCLAVLSAVGCSRLLRAAAGPARYLMAFLMGSLVLAESYHVLEVAPVRMSDHGNQRRGYVVVDMPLGDLETDVQSLYEAVAGQYRTANGYSGYSPQHYGALKRGLADGDLSVLRPLRRLGPVVLSFEASEGPRGGLIEALAAERAVPIVTTANLREFLLNPLPESPADVLTQGDDLQIVRLTATTDAANVRFMLDADPRTRWTGGPQGSDQEIWLDLGEPQSISALVLELGPFTSDFPLRLHCESSIDGSRWEIAWTGGLGAQIVEAALRDPTRIPIVVPLSRNRARFIRVRQIGRDSEQHWSIATLRVVGPDSK